MQWIWIHQLIINSRIPNFNDLSKGKNKLAIILFYLENSIQALKSHINGEFVYNTSVSWKCNLGRLFWNCCDNDIKKAYEQLNKTEFQNLKLDNEDCDPQEFNDPLMNEILSIYCKPENINETLFRERGIDSQNSLVRRTMWSVITSLNSFYLHKDNLDENNEGEGKNILNNMIDYYYSRITFEYAYELETIGLWQWAIFVVLHLKNSSQKTKYIKDIILKNVENDQHFPFLRDSLKIPAHYMNEAKAIYFQGKGNYAQAFLHWMN